MKRCYDKLIAFNILFSDDSDCFMTFSPDWTFTEMLDWMVDHYDIDLEKVVEIQSNFIRRYKVCKDV